MVTVEDVWKGALPEGTALLAGEAGLAAEISRIVSVKPRMPGLEPLQGGELVLLSLRNLHILDPDLRTDAVLESMAPLVGAVALLGEPAPAMTDLAETLAVPLFRLPATASVREVEQAVTAFLLDKRTEWYARKHEIQRILTSLAVEGGSLREIATKLAELSGCAAVITDSTGIDPIIALPGGAGLETARAVEAFAVGRGDIADISADQPPNRRERVAPRPTARLTSVARDTSGSFISVSLVGSRQSLNAEAQLVLECGMTAIAIERSRTLAVHEVAQRIGSDLVTDLMRGHGDPRDLAERARRVGYHLDGGWVAIAMEDAGRAGAASESLGARIIASGLSATRDLPLYDEGARVTLFFPISSDASPPDVRSMVDRTRRDLGRIARVNLGVSRLHAGHDSFRLASREASEALRLGPRLTPSRSVTYFDDLGIHRLLLEITPVAPLEEFHRHFIGRLVDYDEAKKADLVPTLAAWLQGPNSSAVAKRLNLHRNTLSYRMRRITEISGLDLDDPETRFSLRLALKIDELLPAREA
jgi:purine catabolism regulator